ncbi:methylmalonyl Co-A mutase-associated GTPase MeaB [Tunicatimonas pelagia]|uniref:methylmalonyl Co-A mutase-associated GTPase MeaB n=1 Tax=Tunicatimonas pelagia TaxID=931531 RepID=UPI002665E285|nr:methylmalonyl Co-A mutase-associated GTPase MeaB [Tunicatimonas pelagia]WKN44434.1 methylmalonyl Co-A mutase-associated GTPase MeaB [Tunicatimonas pelagia]
MGRKILTAKQYASEIRVGNRFVLSQAITLVESTLATSQNLAQTIISSLLPHTGNSLRLGITGVPGVGKSTFIDQLGMILIQKGHRIAVLSVDPSSQQSKGSILGDKTRMQRLSQQDSAYIRPSAAGSHLGGVAQQTREAILLCEAAGYDVIIIETVGVGQSETLVRHMTDFFLLLMISGAGDELQGMKRGIMEMADTIAINKADDGNEQAAQVAKRNYQQALHLFPPTPGKPQPKVVTCSALHNQGLHEIWKQIQAFIAATQASNYFQQQRQQQQRNWMHELINRQLSQDFFQQERIRKILPQIEEEVLHGSITAREGAERLITLHRNC